MASSSVISVKFDPAVDMEAAAPSEKESSTRNPSFARTNTVHISGNFASGVKAGIKLKKARKTKGAAAAADHDAELAERAKELFDAVDRDGSGSISKAEFCKMHSVLVSDALSQHSRLKRAKRGVLLLAVGILILLSFLGVSVALNFVVVDSVVRTDTSNGELTDKDTGAAVKVALTKMDVVEPEGMLPPLVSSDGKSIVGTREERIELPLVVLPVLADAELAGVRSLVVTFRRPFFEPAKPEPATNDSFIPSPRAKLREQTLALDIVRAARFNTTYATMTAVTGETVEVKNGRAHIHFEAGQKPAKLCLAKTSCSAIALSAESAGEAAALIELAWAALEERGFGLIVPESVTDSANHSIITNISTLERRQLSLAHFVRSHGDGSSPRRRLGNPTSYAVSSYSMFTLSYPCPAGFNLIKSPHGEPRDCHAAAGALRLRFRWTGHWPTLPPGCIRLASRNDVYFNFHHGRFAGPGWRPICAEAPALSYATATDGGNARACPVAGLDFITGYDACRAAASALGPNVYFRQASRTPSWPAGCFRVNRDGPNVYFNSLLHNSYVNPAFFRICSGTGPGEGPGEPYALATTDAQATAYTCPAGYIFVNEENDCASAANALRLQITSPRVQGYKGPLSPQKARPAGCFRDSVGRVFFNPEPDLTGDYLTTWSSADVSSRSIAMYAEWGSVRPSEPRICAKASEIYDDGSPDGFPVGGVLTNTYNYTRLLTCTPQAYPAYGAHSSADTRTIRCLTTQVIAIKWELKEVADGEPHWEMLGGSRLFSVAWDVVETPQGSASPWKHPNTGEALELDVNRLRLGGDASQPFWDYTNVDLLEDKTLPEFTQCALDATNEEGCTCTYWPELTWDYDSQAWVEYCEGGEESSMAQMACDKLTWSCSKPSMMERGLVTQAELQGRRLEAQGDEPLLQTPAGDAPDGLETSAHWADDAAGRQLKHKGKSHKKKKGGGSKQGNICDGGIHDCATNKDDYPPCKGFCSL